MAGAQVTLALGWDGSTIGGAIIILAGFVIVYTLKP